MTRYVNTVYTFVLPTNTSDLPHEVWTILMIQTLDVFIKRNRENIAPPKIAPESFFNAVMKIFVGLAEEEINLAKDHLYAGLMDLISDDVLQPLTLYHPGYRIEPVTAYRIIDDESNEWTWVKLYVRTKLDPLFLPTS